MRNSFVSGWLKSQADLENIVFPRAHPDRMPILVAASA